MPILSVYDLMIHGILYNTQTIYSDIYTATNRVIHDINVRVTGGVARRMSVCLGSVVGL